MYKILIIDDNHSFIDSLKVMLNDFPFQYESEFRYADAEKKIRGCDTYLNRIEIDKIVLYHQLKKSESIKEDEKSSEKEESESAKKSEIEKPQLKKPAINDDGYFLIFIEQDTERNIKGLEFIRNIISTTENYRAEDFILFSNQPEAIEKEAAKTGVLLFEKPLKYPPLRQHIKQRLKKTEEIVTQCNSIMEHHKIEYIKKERKKTAPKPVKKETKNKTAKKTPNKKPSKKTSPKKPAAKNK